MDIIVPVYNGLDDLKKCLGSLLASKNELAWHAFVINDASSDPAVTPYLKGFASEGRLTVLANAENLGFVASVNKGLSLSRGDVVLLNSDTVVCDYWLDRLYAHSQLQPKVATITPLSNNATLASFPELNSETNSSLGLKPEVLHELCYQSNRQVSVKVPTGVGFCMYISRAAIDAVGLLNSRDFGRGYGEENDFCLRASTKGFVNLLACDVYVHHAGGVSFGSEKQERVKQAVTKLNELHPGYDRAIHEFMSLDPIREYRLKVLLKLSRVDKRPVILHVCHNHGGGTLQHIRELAAHFESTAISWALRSLNGDVVRLEWATAPSCYIDIDTQDDQVFFWEILKYIGVSRIHVHHIAGLPQEVFTFIREAGLPYDVSLHDYFFLASNPTLTDSQGRYQPALAYRPELAEWQSRQHAFLKAAERIICPSEVVRDLYEQSFHDLSYQLAPHLDTELSFPHPAVVTQGIKHRPIRVMVLGALNKAKGADLLEAVAKEATLAGEFSFSLLGYAYRQLDSSVRVLGAYQNSEVAHLIETENPDLIWFTATWPETYSYTLSAALGSGKPILAPCLGIFPERLVGRPLSNTYDSLADVASIIAALQDFAHSIAGQAGSFTWESQKAPGCFYQQDYLVEAYSRLEPTLSETELLDGLAYRMVPKLNRKERLLGHLLGLKRFPMVRSILKRIPLERKIKVVKFFTNKNLLDVERQPFR